MMTSNNDEREYEEELRRQLQAYAVKAERARIREWAERQIKETEGHYQDKSPQAPYYELLDFLKEPE